MLGEHRLRGRTAYAGLEGRRAGDLVEADESVQTPQVDGDEGVALRGESTDYRGAACVGGDRDPVLVARGEKRLYFVVRARVDHGGRQVRGVARAVAEKIGCGIAAGVTPARLEVGLHVLRAEDLLQRFPGREL